MKEFAVVSNGVIMGRFDTRIKDGSRWCVNYKGEYTGVLYADSQKVYECDSLEEAVGVSRQLRLDELKKTYEEQVATILTGDWKGY